MEKELKFSWSQFLLSNYTLICVFVKIDNNNCQGPGYSAEERANELFNTVFANSILGVKQLFII